MLWSYIYLQNIQVRCVYRVAEHHLVAALVNTADRGHHRPVGVASVGGLGDTLGHLRVGGVSGVRHLGVEAAVAVHGVLDLLGAAVGQVDGVVALGEAVAVGLLSLRHHRAVVRVVDGVLEVVRAGLGVVLLGAVAGPTGKDRSAGGGGGDQGGEDEDLHDAGWFVAAAAAAAAGSLMLVGAGRPVLYHPAYPRSRVIGDSGRGP